MRRKITAVPLKLQRLSPAALMHLNAMPSACFSQAAREANFGQGFTVTLHRPSLSLSKCSLAYLFLSHCF